MNRLALTYFEIDIDTCSLTYGSAPCTASIPTTGDRKCFNSLKTCQDRTNFATSSTTLRFAIDCDYLPKDIDCIPNIVGVSFTPSTISLGEDLGQRASLSVTFRDHPHSDTGAGFDNYLSSRSYNPYSQGTFWGKFRARHPFVRGRACRWITGYVGQTLAQMETRHFIMDSFSGPSPKGQFTITAKDILKLADDDRSQAPALSNGSILADINSAASSLTLTPNNIYTEYAPSGYVAVGGKEIMAYTRGVDGNDTNCKLLLHFDGANAATSTTDSSSGAKAITRNGDAQLSTAQKVFGTASSLFDGTGDFWSAADSADWTFAGNFTLECRARVTSLAANRTLLCHSTDNNNMYRLYITTTGRLQFDVVSASSTIITLQSATGLIVTNTWYHLAVVRNGNVFTLYIDGSSVGTVTDSDAIPNFTSTFKIGASGNGSSDMMLGNIDEVRVSIVARWTANFTPPDAQYVADGDVLTLTRAQYNTTAIDHKASDLVQQCLVYTGADPANIMYDLLVNYAGVNASFINLSNWTTETAAYLGRVYTAIIAQPVGVRTLLCELIQQTASAMWWDDVGQLIKLQILRSISTDADVFDEDKFSEKTLDVSEQPDKRVSTCYVFYGQRNPLEPIENETNYRSAVLDVDLQTVSDYGSEAIKKIYSRWIPQFGTSIAQRIIDIVLARYKDPPRAVQFEVFRREDGVAPQLGGGYNLQNWSLQDDQGARETVPVQLTRVTPRPEKFIVEGEEALFAATGVIDVNNRVITIDVDTFDFNLRTIHDTLYPVITDGTGITLTCYINSGVSVYASSATARAFDVGSWASGLTINLVVAGAIRGFGGRGGDATFSGGEVGQAGGTALYTRYAIASLDVTGGKIWGGGGGGGGCNTFATNLAGGGGSGAGKLTGRGGVVTAFSSDNRYWGGKGTETTGGVGGQFGGSDVGGAGGGPGLAGGSASFGAAGGAAGKAIDGISYVTITGAGDRRGSEVN